MVKRRMMKIEEEGKLDISGDILQTCRVLQNADHQNNGRLKVWHL